MSVPATGEACGARSDGWPSLLCARLQGHTGNHSAYWPKGIPEPPGLVLGAYFWQPDDALADADQQCPQCGGTEALIDPDRGGVCTDCVDQIDQLDPWFTEQAEHEQRARQLYDEALGEQLMRGFLAAGRSDTVRQLVRDLFRAGFTMHDCRGAFGRKHEGGVCLVPLSSVEGIGVSWAQHDVSYDNSADHQDVQEVCTDWLRDLMTVLGWRTEDFGTAGAFRVTGRHQPVDFTGPPPAP